MGDIVNLRTARKRKARDDAARYADQNRLLHGRSKAEKSAATSLGERDAAFLDGHRLDGKPDISGPSAGQDFPALAKPDADKT